MKLIADSGSTKTDWALLTLKADGARKISCFATQGINPIHQSVDTIKQILDMELLPQIEDQQVPALPLEIYFYGAGCVGNAATMVSAALREAFGCKFTSVKICVESDLLAAARSLCGHAPGIACILGTRANSCLFDGNSVVKNIPPLGYILGDEGSGAVLGRLFINALYKEELPTSLREHFLSETGLTYADIINNVYRQPLANRFLASCSTFIHAHIEVEGVRSIVIENFLSFIRKNVLKYQRPDLSVHAIGSIAWHYQDELREAVMQEGLILGTVLKSPMDGLIRYHEESSSES